MNQELLPVGSVVQLADSTALVMIAGYLPMSGEQRDTLWDYSGFRFPIGYTDDEDIYYFNHEQIETVYAYGYRDVESDIFMSRLRSALEKAAGDAPEDGGEE